MGNIFTASEILEIAIQIEKNGRDFYGAFAAQSKNSKTQEMFKFLAQEENRHIEVFSTILTKTDQYEPQGLDVDQYSAYMKTLAGESVFTQKDKGRQIALAIKTEQEAISVGIKAEKDSIVFYQGIKKVVSAYEQKIIDEVIDAEEDHLRQLTQLLQSL